MNDQFIKELFSLLKERAKTKNDASYTSQLINDPDLLAGNDPYFVTYKEDPDTYDYILKNVSFPIKMEGMVSDVKRYYDLEICY